jgi:hypothetical protein
MARAIIQKLKKICLHFALRGDTIPLLILAGVVPAPPDSTNRPVCTTRQGRPRLSSCQKRWFRCEELPAGLWSSASTPRLWFMPCFATLEATKTD